MAPWVTGVKTGHTFDAGYVLVGSGRRKGVDLISVAIGAPSDEARYRDNLELLEYGFRQYRQRLPIRAGAGSRRSLDPLLRRRAAAAGRPQRRRRPAHAASGSSVEVDAPAEVEGPIRRGAALGTRDASSSTAATPPRSPLRAGRAIPSASAFDRVRGFLGDNPIPIALAVFVILIGGVLLYRRLAPQKRPRGADSGEGRVILTVTLNAAIDRTVAVPNFRLGRRHRAVESRTVAGGKGINVARALSLLGRPVIAAGFVGGPTGTRVLEQLREESVLTDFTRIAAETRINLAVIDPDLRRADRDQRARTGGQPGGDQEALRADRLPGRAAPRSASWQARCRPAPATISTRA